MRYRNQSIISVIFTFIILGIIFKYFWPILLFLFIVIIGVILYISSKSKKIVEKQKEYTFIQEDSDYDDWINQSEKVDNPDIIDVEYTEHKE